MKNVRIFALGIAFLLCGSTHAKLAGPLAVSFEENRGQAPADVQFLARGQGYGVAFTSTGNRVALRHGARTFAVATRLEGGNSKSIKGEKKLEGQVNYFRTGMSLAGIPTYGKIRYERVYPGIDLVYYGNQQQLEYDFVVSPGADPGQIQLRFDGIDAATVDDRGDLVLRTNGSELKQRRPIVYQKVGNSHKQIDGSYRLLASNLVTFDIGSYDRNATLVIDPILSYSTFFGGANGDDDARAVTVDSAGNLYIAGSTTSTNLQTTFPVQPNSANQDPSITDAFVTKLNPAGTALMFSTYFGGTSDDDGNGLVVDLSGSVTVVGTTSSTDLPTTSGALRRTCNTGPTGCMDIFVLRLTPAGSGIVYSTYLGGTGDDDARAVGIDALGNVYITGKTDSTDYPTTFGAYSTDPLAGGFVTKLTTTGQIAYSTYFGTFSGPANLRGIAVDAAGNAYLTGTVDAGGNTGVDAFIAKLQLGGGSIEYTQFIRGAKDDTANAIAIDSAGNVYVTGETSSVNFPITTTAVQTRFGGGPAFRTGDAGSNWNIAGTGINRTSLYALAVTPSATSTIYVGADDETAGGLFRSTDGGNTWTNVGSGISDSRIHALAVDPATAATVYAGSRGLGVYKSTNSGTSWSPTTLNSVFVTSLVIDPAVPATVYAGTDANGIYKSVNGGVAWSPINGGLASSAVRSIVVDPVTNSTVYAATAAGIYKSTNGGGTWVAASSGLFDPNVNVLVLDPQNPNVIFAGTNSVGVFRSANGGGLWVPSNGGLSSSASVSALTIDPTSGTLYAGVGESNAMRVYKSANGATWTATGLASTRLTVLAADKSNSGTVYAATVGGTDAFVAKWNPSGSLAYSTFLGGARNDAGNAIGVDSTGGMYIAGSTSSANFPKVNALQPNFGGGSDVVSDAFAAKLNTSGSELDFSTYLGGSSNDFGKGIAVDASNTAYVVGTTASSDFPTASALNPNRLGLADAFIVKIGEGSAISYAVPIRGGFSATSQGGGTNPVIGYGRVQQTSAGANPSGLAIFGLRQNNVLVSEAAVPASLPITNGRIYAEVAGPVNTGIAIANPNATSTTINYYFTDRDGQNSAAGATVIAPNGQIAKFLNEGPFNGGSSFFGTFTFTASQPVAVIALRVFANERGDSLITTLPVANLSVSADSDPILFPHYADGGGWTTQIVLVNTTDIVMTGSVQFAGLGSQDYTIPVRSAVKVVTPGVASGTLTGLARVTPSAGPSPNGVAVFSFKKSGITVTEAGISPLKPGTAFRLYAEASGTAGQNGYIQTGLALANPSSSTVQVTFEITTITGVSTGLVGSLALPGNGQVSMFLGEITGFGALPNPFQGVLRVSTNATTGLSLVGLRGRYNERGDFLITTTQPTSESAPLSATEQFFPHFVDGGGYTTQFILYNGSIDQASSGLIRFVGQSGQSLSLAVH